MTTTDNLDLAHAREVLDEDHYDLEKVKDRIIEHLAVSKLRNDPSGQILCFVGPPGVGKTSLGQSIARTLERKFARLSVGGVRDEAEMRGHRRTYIGAMPGSIIRALRDAESMNPRAARSTRSTRWAPTSAAIPRRAMLEVLDPEQNRTFRDHYLDLPFDLSKVLFICTANTVDTIPGPLLDRMDVISLSGYTEDEKLGIAKRYLVPKQIEAHGLTARAGHDLRQGAAARDPRVHARGGVRGLERRIADLCRKAARKVAEGFERRRSTSTSDACARGSARGTTRARCAGARPTPGVATGLAYTAAGGDVLFIEAQAYPGKGKLTITGQLGEVMQESAQAALSWVRSHADRLGAPGRLVRGARRARPRAGRRGAEGRAVGRRDDGDRDRVARARHCRSSNEVGMTGEITLTGQVLPIGGVREKVLAAQRAGLKRVVLPRENELDLEDLPPETRRDLEFVLVDSIEQVFDVAFDGAEPSVVTRPPRRSSGRLLGHA